MDLWGHKMLDCINTVSEMSAIGFDLEKNTFTSLLNGGAHLLAPTGSDLNRYDVSSIFAGRIYPQLLYF